MNFMRVKQILKRIVVPVALIAAMTATSGCSVGISRKYSASYNIDQEKSMNIDGVKEIAVSTSSTDVKIISADSKELKFHYHGRVRVSTDVEGARPEISDKAEGSKIALTESMSKGITSYSINGSIKLDIYLPRQYSENVTVSTASGEIDIEDCNSNYTISTASGRITLKDKKDFNNNLTFQTASGDVRVYLPQNAEFSLKANTASGQIKSDFPGINVKKSKYVEGTEGSGKNKITIGTASGDISVLR